MATPPDPRFAPASSLETQLLAGYRRATSFAPIKAKERDTVFKGYGLQAGVSKGKSDAQLQSLAASTVLGKFKKSKAVAAAKPAPTYIQSQLKKAGFANSTPPPYALVSQAAFDAWLRRAQAYAAGH